MGWYDKININLNQNLWGLLIGYLALGLSDFYELELLYTLSAIFAITMTSFVLVAFFFYTFKYIKKKNQ